ncbi:hypothetical protein NAP1_13738 [Erythrobacter sp. NAP1]|uniref:hypothetical protein n=1 Tax=Erythrobacter sp. NAP1 TaxID=237727 RepID=UPI000068795F|nr:hypothetical protein [Erythrobacter sp. NAP1]EAQ28665.1 hypothetical protein NAP1_13738 [Erythrobacter sp. NAP1]
MKMTVNRLDKFLVLPLIASLVMIAEIDAPMEQAIKLSSLIKGVALGGATLAMALIVAAATAIDRRCSEDYIFQILANAALVALTATMMINLFWVLGEKVVGLPELASDNILGVVTLSWVISYYWFRVRGIAQ